MGRVQRGGEVELGEGERERRQDRHSALIAPSRRVATGDDGSGFISTTVGVFTFLVFLFLAVQVTYNLYATTMVTSAASDAARRLAGAAWADDTAAEGRAEAWVRELLGDYGDAHIETVDVDRTSEVVRLRVVARNPGFVPLSIRRPLGFDRIDRTVTVRIERVAP